MALKNFLFDLAGQVLVIIFVVVVVHPNGISAQCNIKKTCDDCIRTKDCVWCKDPEFPDDNPKRCTLRTETLSDCRYYEQVNQTINITRDNPTITAKDALAKNKRRVHIAPQVINLELKVGDPVTVKLEYLDAEDKPLDLYYLMDLSHTMSDDRATVAKQSQDLAKKLKEVTSDVRFGFGSFVDKPVMPFASSAQIHLPKGDVVAPYSFKNHLKLTSDTVAFAREVQQAKNSSNLDEPEGSLDAIMQVIACESEIGWRDDARKLLIVFTDGSFHVAGDGKLAGIVMPNDMKCHLDNNSYTHEKILDYPSIGQLNVKVKEAQVHVIFAVTANQQRLYEKLRARIDGSEVVTFEKDSSNVAEIIRKEYKKLKETLELIQEPEKTDDLKITYTYNCDGDGDHSHEFYHSKPRCTIKEAEQRLLFNITLELLEEACIGQTRFDNKEVKIYPFSLRTEALTLNIKTICDCPCKNQGLPDMPGPGRHGILGSKSDRADIGSSGPKGEASMPGSRGLTGLPGPAGSDGASTLIGFDASGRSDTERRNLQEPTETSEEDEDFGELDHGQLQYNYHNGIFQMLEFFKTTNSTLAKINDRLDGFEDKIGQIKMDLKAVTDFSISTKEYERRTPKAKFYMDTDHKGIVFEYNIKEDIRNPNCVNAPPCLGGFKSVNTFGSCVRIYLSTDCSGPNTMFSPITHNHHYIQDQWQKFRSVGPCSP